MVQDLISESKILIKWFDFNGMQANHGKFQAIMLGTNGHELCSSITIDDINIKCEDYDKQLGADTDNLLNFDVHI